MRFTHRYLTQAELQDQFELSRTERSSPLGDLYKSETDHPCLSAQAFSLGICRFENPAVGNPSSLPTDIESTTT